jgi:hypothetical protein
MIIAGKEVTYGSVEAITVSTSAIGISSLPTTIPIALVTVDVEAANIRYRADGSDPTASIGTPAYNGERLVFDELAEINKLKLIRKGSTDATCTVTYWATSPGYR